MHVCHLVHHLANGGLEQQILELARFSDDDFTVCYLGEDDTLAQDFREEGVTVIDLEAGVTDPRAVFDPRVTYGVARFLSTRNFDIFHAHTPLYVQIVARVAASLTGETMVCTYHNRQRNFHPLMQYLERLTRSLSDCNVGVSNAVEESFTGSSTTYQGGEPGASCTIHNGIDVAGFGERVQAADTKSVREKYDIQPGCHVILTVGRYAEQKRQSDLIRAMEQVVAEISNAHLVLVGHGQLEENLREMSRAKDLINHVTVTGEVPDVEPYYAIADVFTLSSIREGLPIVLIEAMAASLPIVATRVSGVPEAVNHGVSGFLVKPKSPDEIANNLTNIIINNRNRKFGDAGQERAVKRFSISTTSARYTELYESTK